MGMVQQQYVRISFMIAGHTKFAPDLLFAQSFSKSDIFSTQELVDIASLYATVTLDKGDIVRDWRTNLAK